MPRTGRDQRLMIPRTARLKRWFWRGVTVCVVMVLVLLLISTPFLARGILWGLNQIDYQVDPIAAAAHQVGGLVDVPESPDAATDPSNREAPNREAASIKTPDAESPKTANAADQSASTSAYQTSALTDPQQDVQRPLDRPALRQILEQLPTSLDALLPQNTLHNVALPNASATVDGQTWRMAQVIVVLGGGLGRDYQRHIVPNVFSRLRLSQAILQHQATGLPIVLSGVEAPWMREWLLAQGVDAALLEQRSMNTCENARFSALLLQKQGGAPRIELVTDAYHMPRSRRLFAMNGIDTVPVIAPLPGDPAPWWPDRRNLVHTRRAIHELAATIRDLWFGEINCREVP